MSTKVKSYVKPLAMTHEVTYVDNKGKQSTFKTNSKMIEVHKGLLSNNQFISSFSVNKVTNKD